MLEDLEVLKNDFPIFKQKMHGAPLVYLDSAATAQKPGVVIETINDFYKNHYGTVHRSVYELSTHATTQYQNVRELVASFINAAKSEEIIFTKGTTESINLVARSFGQAFIQPGDEILITAMEHHSNIVPWQMMCEERKGILRAVPIHRDGTLDMDAYATLLKNHPKLVAITHISNALGTINPIKDIIAMAHQAGAKVLIDGAQSIAHLPIDVSDLDADFFVFSGHKLYGPTGIGILYGKEALLSAMPPFLGGGDMIKHVTLEKTTYAELPLKFEAGTPQIAEVLGLGAAIKYVNEIGLTFIHSHEKELFTHCEEALKQIKGLKIIGTAPDKGALISFIIDNIHPLDIGTMLDLKGIAVRTGHHCAQPVMQYFGIPGTVRASFALYNTKDDIDYFVESLKHVIKLF